VDHLEPIGSKYFSNAKELLFEGMNDLQIVQIIVIPAFGTESFLAIEIDTSNFEDPKFNFKNAKYNLVYYKHKIIKEPNVENEKSDKVEVIKYRKEINASSVMLVDKLFESAILHTRYPGNFGLDGVRYIFTSNYGQKAGMYWGAGIPSKVTKMGKLTSIGNKLFEMVKSENEYIEFDDQFIREIENLIREFN